MLAPLPPGDVNDISRRGDSSDFMGELESVCRGLRVPDSLGAFDPDPGAPLPLKTEVEEEGGLSGDCILSSFLRGDPGVGEDGDICS